MFPSRVAWSLMLVAAVAGPRVGWSDDKLVALNIYPPDLHLRTRADSQRFIVVATREDGVTLDVTSQAQVHLEHERLCRREGNRLWPAADGQTTLHATYQGLNASASISVEEAQAERPISFQLDVMPVFMRGGCNTGSCHGAARGKDGFRLSLFGFDPQGDYYRLTREIGTRRINLAVPEESLLIEKAIGAVPHTGGKRFSLESDYGQTLLAWLRAGAPSDAQPPPAVVGVDLYPPGAVLEGEGTTQQFIARARYADGTDRDVTDLAVFMSNNDTSAPISPEGVVTAASRGEAFIMARFETHTVGHQVLVLPKGLEFTPTPAGGNYIDELVIAKLNKLRIAPSPLCSDEEFLRRVTIDITGLLPTEQEYHAFLADSSPDKRQRLVDELLQRPQFAEIWAMKWAELLMVKTTNQVSNKSTYLYATWLTEQLAHNVPLDQIVRSLIAATGGTLQNPPATFYQVERDTLKMAENVAQVFCGIRTQCAQCHNHPFDRWTMDDYYSFAAFFAQVGRKTGEDYRETIIYNRGSGDVRHPVGGRVMAPKFLGGPSPAIPPGTDRRQVLADWLTSPDNPFFATSVANRVWAHFFGQGIVEPVDDIRVSNPPSNPELFEALGAKFAAYGYDLRKLVRDICTSQTYQRSCERNESNAADERNFAHATARRIPAEQLLDCISQATGAPDKFPGLPAGARAVQIADGRTSNYFLNTFGRSPRDTVCACDAKTEPTLSQALHLLNGGTIQGKIQQGGLVRRWLAEKKPLEEILDQLYIRCLTRRPTPEEQQQLLSVVQAAPNPEQGLEDVFWAILNAREFLFNH